MRAKSELVKIEPKVRKAWLRLGPNAILEGDGFYISYNPGDYGPFPFFKSDFGGDETALVKDEHYWILNGDFRDEYERVIDSGYDACLKVYQQNWSNRSSWSTDDDD